MTTNKETNENQVWKSLSINFASEWLKQIELLEKKNRDCWVVLHYQYGTKTKKQWENNHCDSTNEWIVKNKKLEINEHDVLFFLLNFFILRRNESRFLSCFYWIN